MYAPVVALLALSLAAEPFDLRELNRDRLRTNRLAMGVLAGWAAANIASGVLGGALDRDPQRQALFFTNAAWNVVNALLAGMALYGNLTTDPAALDFKASVAAAAKVEKIYLVNAGLDAGYVVAGVLLWQLGAARLDPRLDGVGQSVLVQGICLLVFDTVMFFGT